jgi:hypothetical protein
MIVRYRERTRATETTVNRPKPIALLHTSVESSGSNELIQLAKDLAELRPNRALTVTFPWMHYLTEFYRHPMTLKFEAIDGDLLGHQVLLLSKVDNLADFEMRSLIGELANLNQEHFDHHGGSKLYVALNRLVRNRVNHMKAKPRKKRRTLY